MGTRGVVKGVNKGYPTVPGLDLSDAGHVNRFWRDKSPASTSPASASLRRSRELTHTRVRGMQVHGAPIQHVDVACNTK